MSRSYTAIDLSLLPAPSVIETLDYETVLASIVADYRARYPDFSALLESEPVVKLLEVVAYLAVLTRQRVNDGARAVMLAYATGSDLDNLGGLFGVVRLAGEDDTPFRRRILLSLEGFSTAGPDGAYLFHALSASNAVRDASVSSPEPGVVRVAVLGVGDGTPTADALAAVTAILNGEDVRPLTDTVQVAPARIRTYAVQAHLEIQAGPAASVVLETAQRQLAAYVQAAHVLGGRVTVSGLTAALHPAGVWRVTLTEPATDIAADGDQAPYCVAVNLSHQVVS